MRKHRPMALGSLVRGSFGQFKMGPAIEVIRAWPKVAGSLIASHLTAVRFAGGVLYLLADQAVWGHQLPFLAPDLLARYDEVMGPGLVKDLRLTTHAQLPESPMPLQVRSPEPPLPGLAPLPASEEEAIAKEAATFITKPDLADRFAAVQKAVKRLQQGRRLAGGRPCVVCGVPHSDPGPRCMLCRRV